MFNITRNGLDAIGKELGVISNNIANANTNAFKRSRSEFQLNFFDKDHNVIIKNLKNFKNINYDFEQNLLRYEKIIINPEKRKNKLEAILLVNYYHNLIEVSFLLPLSHHLPSSNVFYDLLFYSFLFYLEEIIIFCNFLN